MLAILLHSLIKRIKVRIMMFLVCSLFAGVCATCRIWDCIGSSIHPDLVAYWLCCMAVVLLPDRPLQDLGWQPRLQRLQHTVHLRSQVSGIHHYMIQNLRKTTGSHFPHEGEAVAGKNKGMRGSKSSMSGAPPATALLALLSSFSQAAGQHQETCPDNHSANTLETNEGSSRLMSGFPSALLLVLLGIIITLTVQSIARCCKGTAGSEEGAAPGATTTTTPGEQSGSGRLVQQAQRTTTTNALAAAGTPLRWAMPPQQIYITEKGGCYHAPVCSSTKQSAGVKAYRLCSKCTDNHVYASSQTPQPGASSSAEGYDRSGGTVTHIRITSGRCLTRFVLEGIASDVSNKCQTQKNSLLHSASRRAAVSLPSEASAASNADEQG